MTIGTSLGNHYQDEHHYQARSFTPFPGFHQSENVEDRRQEFFDPRTDPMNNTLEPGAWMQQDNETQGDETSPMARALGSTDLDLGRIKQIDQQSTQMEDELLEAEKKAGVTPEDSGLPGDEWQQWNSPLPRKGPDLPRKKTDQEIRDESNALH